jgi:hypothetical protein
MFVPKMAAAFLRIAGMPSTATEEIWGSNEHAALGIDRNGCHCLNFSATLLVLQSKGVSLYAT